MLKSEALNVHASRFSSGKGIGQIIIRPSFVIGFNLLLIAISLGAGRLAYLLIALAVTSVALLLVSSDFTTGVLWMLGMSTVTGFYQRLILYKSGQSPSTDFVRFGLEVSVLIYFALLVSSRFNRPVRMRVKWLDVAITFYLLLSTLYAFNLFYVREPLITIYGWRWVCLPLLMYYLGRMIGSKPGMLDRIDKYIVVLLILQAGYGAYQAIVGYPSFEQPWITQRAAMQISAAVEDSFFIAGKARIPALTEGHAVSGFLIPMLFLWLLFVQNSLLSKRWRILRRVALFCGILFLIFSNERSAIGMVGVGIGLVVFLNARKKLGIGIFLIAIPSLAFIVLIMSQIDPSQIPWSPDTIVLRRLLELLNPFKSGTLAGRMHVHWPVFWRFFVANPWGYGLGSFRATSATEMSEWGRSPHNMYLQVLLETGAVGLFLFLAVFFVYFKYLYSFNKMRLSAIQRSFMLSASSLYIAFLAIGIVNHPIETFPLAIHFWFLMGFAISFFINSVQINRVNI